MSDKMEARKIQRSASGSYIITLPKSWIERTQLNKGDRVNIEVEEDGSLRLLPAERDIAWQVEFEVDMEKYPDIKLLERCLKSCYIEGCDVINLDSKERISVEDKKMLKRSIVDLIGTEVADESSNRVTIRTLVDPTRFTLDAITERIFLLVCSMHYDAMMAFEENDMDLANDVISRYEDVEKLYRLIIRQMTLAVERRDIAERIGIRKNRECIINAISARDITRIGYHSAEIAKLILELSETKIDPAMKGMLNEMSRATYEMEKNTHDAFAKSDMKLANEVMDKMDEIRQYDANVNKQLMKVTDKMNVRTASTLLAIARNLRRIAGYSVAVADNASNKAISDLRD